MSGDGLRGGDAPDWSVIPFENIDRLLLVEARLGGTISDIVPALYSAARASGMPLSLQVANAVMAQRGGKLALITGVYLPPYFPCGEIDGPVGAMVIAHVLQGLGWDCVIVTEAEVGGACQRVADRLGWSELQFEDAGGLDSDTAVDLYARTLDMAIAIERTGISSQGITHSLYGTPDSPSPLFPWADRLVERLSFLGRPTVGIGDGGNEIGFGKIYEAARSVVPFGADCGCPCGAGIVAQTATQYLMPVSVSDLGVYGVLAALGILARDTAFLHTAADERELLRVAVEEGMVDGGTGTLEEAEDGIPVGAVCGFLDLLAGLVSNALREYQRSF